MSAYEFAQWKVLERIDPWGQRRADYRAARIVQAACGIMNKRAPRLTEILKMFNFVTEQQSTEEIMDIFHQIAGQ